MKLGTLCLLLAVKLSGTTKSSAEKKLYAKYYNRCQMKSQQNFPDQFNCGCHRFGKNHIAGHPIPTEEFIPKNWTCDALTDCADGSDELHCICDSDHFQCGCHHGSGCEKEEDIYLCLPLDMANDNDDDCANKMDEANSCNFSDSSVNVCDGRIDCADGFSDEANCTSCPSGKLPCDCFLDRSKPCRTQFKLKKVCYNKKQRCDGYVDCTDASDEQHCENIHEDFDHRCQCNGVDSYTCTGTGRTFYEEYEKCNGELDCIDGSDEIDCEKSSDEDYINRCDCNQLHNFTCRGANKLTFYSDGEHCDGYINCADGSDERWCEFVEAGDFRCACNQQNNFSCKTTHDATVYSEKEKCDRHKDCSDGSDEANCPNCSEEKPLRCACNPENGNLTCLDGWYSCFSDDEMCDLHHDCSDKSDETNCSCPSGTFTCDCYRTSPVTCPSGIGCISLAQVDNEIKDCPNGEDEDRLFQTFMNGTSIVTLYDHKDVAQCDNIKVLHVNILECFVYHPREHANTTCTVAICDQHIGDHVNAEGPIQIFICSDGNLRLSRHFCDGVKDCPDGSDEIRFEPGFKCHGISGSCVLPEVNLHDTDAQCKDGSDLISEKFFHCLDNLLVVSESQLCNGVFDCFDWSDECLCQAYLNEHACVDLFTSSNADKRPCGEINPDCRNVSTPTVKIARCGKGESQFLLKSCVSRLGVISAELCDGVPECSDFSDECSCENPPAFCSDSCHSFYQLGDRYCDGINDDAWKFINDRRCQIGFDEKNCFAPPAPDTIFSSDTEMIANVALRVVIAVMACFVLVSNAMVIYTSISYFRKTTRNSAIVIFHRIAILNLSIADFLMGVYLLVISIKSAQFSGSYNMYDSQWRSSILCIFAGCLAILSSQASSLIINVVTSFRLYTVYHIATLDNSSLQKWNAIIALVWFTSFLLSIIPAFPLPYFVHHVSFPSEFSSSDVWKTEDAMKFTCNLAVLSNKTYHSASYSWNSALTFLEGNFPQYFSKDYFGYYGETSICLPRLYVKQGDYGWEYTLFLVILNFLSFLYITCAYILIIRRSSNSEARSQSSKKSVRHDTMRRRVAVIVLTDFLCWMPICLMAFAKMGGAYLSNDAYLITAGLLLPINSALNPIFYSEFFNKLLKKLPFSRMPDTSAISLSTRKVSFNRRQDSSDRVGAVYSRSRIVSETRERLVSQSVV